ncbi:MAG: hypothetical protein ACOC7M_01975 [Chloroflexota bacterium]
MKRMGSTDQSVQHAPVVYVDRSEIVEGKIGDLKSAISDLSQFVSAMEPRIVSYAAYFSADEKRMTVIHVHPDSASLETHMDVAGSQFPKFADYVRLLGIEVYGQIGDSLLAKLQEKVRLLGEGSVSVADPRAGFVRTVVA